MIWMRRGDCPAVFSLEILRRNPCTGEESAPRETRRGTQQIFKQTDVAFRSHNTSAPQNGIFIQTPQGLARRGFKNQNPARGRKRARYRCQRGHIYRFKNQNPARGRKLFKELFKRERFTNLRTRTPQGDGNYLTVVDDLKKADDLRTRTPQGDGNAVGCATLRVFEQYLRTRTPQGDGNRRGGRSYGKVRLI